MFLGEYGEISSPVYIYEYNNTPIKHVFNSYTTQKKLNVGETVCKLCKKQLSTHSSLKRHMFLIHANVPK